MRRPKTAVHSAGRGRRVLNRLQLDDVRFTLELYKCYKRYQRADGSTWECACLRDADVWHGPVVYAHDTRVAERWAPGQGGALRRWYCAGWEWQEALDAAASAEPLSRAIAARVLGRRRRTRKIGE